MVLNINLTKTIIQMLIRMIIMHIMFLLVIGLEELLHYLPHKMVRIMEEQNILMVGQHLETHYEIIYTMHIMNGKCLVMLLVHYIIIVKNLLVLVE